MPITQTASATADATGRAEVRVGPESLAEVWTPTMATVRTGVGPTDPAECRLFLATAHGWELAGTSTGGADTAGIQGVQLRSGNPLVAVWTGTTAGTLCTLTVQADVAVQGRRRRA